MLHSTSFPDIQSLGHDNKLELVEELLTLMARDKHSPEVSEANRQHAQNRLNCHHNS